MVLSLFLRNGSRIRVSPNLLRPSTFSVNPALSSRKTFTQFLNKYAAAPGNSKINCTIGKRAMSGGNHNRLWTIEKLVALALVGVIPATFMFPSDSLDNVFAVLLVTHLHWGLEGIALDYARPIVVGSLLSSITMGMIHLISAVTLGALLYYNNTCAGIGCTAHKLWEIKE